jgi:ABC-type transport system involved in cytochrome bd biosynthesis fused ATPase/permease subunit
MFETTSYKVRKQVLGLLTNRWGLGSFALLTCQQAMEASAMFWLVFLIQAITSGTAFFHFLLLYLSSLIIPYIPWCLAFVLRTTWKQEALRSFINAFIASNRNNIGEWNNKGIQEEKLSILTAEAPSAINLLIDYIFDLYSYVMSVFFNIIALSIAVEPLFALAYGASVTCVFLVMKLKRRTQRKLTKKALTARVDLTQSLLAAWDNVLLGNDYNFRLWQERTNQRMNRSLRKNVDLERFDQITAILAALMTSIPSLLVVIYFAWTHRADPVRLSSFIVVLPMLFLILTYTYHTLALAFRWGMHKSKLVALFKAIQPIRDHHLEMVKKVKWDKIRLMAETVAPDDHVSLALPKNLQSPLDLVARAEQAGRLTLRGENGSGKSTLLMLIKHALQDRAYFLPTHNQLSFEAETNKYSTGESLKNRLLEILEKVDADVLLLDEWDANLDQENREKLSQIIDEIAARKCVIEVRHR